VRQGVDVVNTCRTCRAPILWAVTIAGNSIPVDPEPVPDGNIELLDRSELRMQPRAVVIDPAQTSLDAAPRYVSHFVTCPQADQHRKART
jgi:hypothetical protein